VKTRSMSIQRREILGAGAAAAFACCWPDAPAQAKDVTVLGHRVHQSAATTGPGGDATAAYRDAAKAGVNWITLGDVNAIHEKLLREASLASGSVDVAFMLNGRASARNLSLFEPLDALLKEAPIEDMKDFASGLVAPFRSNGSLYGIPVRHSTNALLYNEEILAERGVDPHFRTFEEFLAAARKLTYRRADGVQVVGLSFAPQFAAHFLTLSRAIGADFMTAERAIVAAEGPMIRFIEGLAGLYQAGAMPRNFAAINNEEVASQIQQGRCAMTLNSLARLPVLNDPAKSKYPGKIKPKSPPLGDGTPARGSAYNAPVEFWALLIPRNSANKRQAWDFIRSISSKAATLQMAKNGNGPTRVSTYKDLSSQPFALAEASALAGASPPLPALDEQSRVHDVFIEEIQAAILGMKPARQAMTDATRRVRPMVFNG
jgi:multiple sugar transport system substrate-binding protein